jgi:hypothetical protein
VKDMIFELGPSAFAFRSVSICDSNPGSSDSSTASRMYLEIEKGCLNPPL